MNRNFRLLKLLIETSKRLIKLHKTHFEWDKVRKLDKVDLRIFYLFSKCKDSIFTPISV